MWTLRGVCLALALFGLASAALSLALPAAAAVLRRWTRGRSAGLRADLLLAVRLAPSALALLLAFALFVPAYAAFEPPEGGETVSALLWLVAAASLIPLVVGMLRGIQAWRATRRLLARWTRAGSAVRLAGWPAPALRTIDAFPVVSAVGLLRPRLFIAAQVLERLGSDELEAVLAHEATHVESCDNLKALLARASMDWLALLPAGRRLADEWRHAAELAADERGRRAGDGVALALASALVRVAQLVPAGARLGSPATALVNGAGVADRVARLLARGRPGAAGRDLSPGQRLRAAVLLAGVLAAAATEPRALEAVHALGEAVLRLLT